MKPSLYERHKRLILVVALVCLPLAVIGARQSLKRNNNDVRTWLPDKYEETNQYQWFKSHFGTEEFVLVTWNGCTLDDPKLEVFAEKVLPPAGHPNAGVRHELFKSVITGPRILNQLTAPPSSLSRAAAISRLKGKLIGPDGTQTCAVITPTEGAKDRLHEMLATVREVAANECGVPLEQVKLGGPPVINAAVDTEGAKSLSRLAALSGVIGVCIAWWCFRSLKITAFIFITAVYSAALALAVVFFCGGGMNAILLTMPPLVYVAAMSGAIHLANYYREALAEKGPQAAPSCAVAHARLPLMLATITTAIGLLSLCYSELLPIKQFGVYSAIGVIGSALVLFFVLPAALQQWPLREKNSPPHADEAPLPHDEGLLTLSRRWESFARWVIGRANWVTLSCVLLFAGSVVGMQWMKTSIKIEKFFGRSTDVIKQYHWMEQHLGALVPMELVVRINDSQCDLNTRERMELIERIQRNIEQLPDVGSTMSAVTYAPDLTTGSYVKLAALNNRLEKHQDEFIKAGFLRLAEDEQLWRISLRVGADNDVDYGAFVAEIRKQVEPLLEAERATGTQGLSAVYTGLVPVVYKAQRSLLDGLLFGFSTDLLLIVAAITLTLRHWTAGVLITLTSMFPAALVFGGMSWLGIAIDIGTVMAPSVALGVSVDDVVHFLLWFKRGIQRGLDRRQAVMLAYQGCAKPMYQSWGVIGLGLSVFALSPFIPTFRFGALMITLLTAGLANNLLFLPSLLAGPLGELFARRIRRVEERAAGRQPVRALVKTAAEAERRETFGSPRRPVGVS